MDKSAMAEFIEADSCRRGVMSGYLDGKETTCTGSAVEAGREAPDMARCDRCGEGVAEWQASQAEAASEWQVVRRVLDELADGCAACWVTVGGEDAHLHPRQDCSAVAELSEEACKEFQARMFYARDSHSCTRCGISQEFCATGVSLEMACQWPGVVIPMVRAMMGGPQSLAILQQVGYTGELRDWEAYRRWLGRRHGRRVWGKRMSNAMVVVIRVILYMNGGG